MFFLFVFFVGWFLIVREVILLIGGLVVVGDVVVGGVLGEGLGVIVFEEGMIDNFVCIVKCVLYRREILDFEVGCV